MVSLELENEQAKADIERTKVMTREVEMSIKMKEIQIDILKQELASKQQVTAKK